MSMSQKILAAHAGLDRVEPGQLISARVDLALGNDITAPVAIEEYRRHGFGTVFDRRRIALVLDHFTPCKDIKSAELCKTVREFAQEQKIEHFYDVGTMGVEHALLPELGLAAPGELIVGADSHTCTYGALGAFSTGVGSTDLAAAMATGTAWFKVPAALRFVLENKPSLWVSGKDVILHILGLIGVDGALYKSMEFTGGGLCSLSVDERLTMANMAVEAGAKNGLFETDAAILAYLEPVVNRPFTAYGAGQDAAYEKTFTIDLSAIRPLVARPHRPDNVIPADDMAGVAVDQVVIGSCTNGRLDDLRAAAAVFRGRRVARGLRALVIPATQRVYRQALDEGLLSIFIDAGCAVSTPTCGPCLGGHMGVLADGERCVATTNRNFVGRMGHPGSEIYLAGPAVAAASAVAGTICSPTALGL